jgi:hypothetical protein
LGIFNGWELAMSFKQTVYACGVVLLVFGVGVLLSYPILRPLGVQFRAESDLAKEIALLDASDPDWTLEAIERNREPIADAENAAISLMRLNRAIPKDWPIWSNWSDPGKEPEDATPEEKIKFKESKDRYEVAKPLQELEGKRRVLPPASKALLVAELGRVKEVVEEAEVLQRFAKARFVLDGDEINSTHLLDALVWQCELDAQNGDTGNLFERAALIAHTGRWYPSDNSWNLIYRWGTWRRAINAMTLGLSLGEVSERRLAEFQRMLHEEEMGLFARYLNAFRYGRACTHQHFLKLASGEIEFDRYTKDTVPDAWAYNSLGIKSWRLHHVLFLRESNEHIEKFKNGWNPEDTGQGGFRWCLSCIPEDKWYQRFSPEIQNHVWQYHCFTGALRAAQFGIACERYRIQHGKWPDRAESLVPRFIQEVPLDPLARNRLKLEKNGDHWEVLPLMQRWPQIWLWNPEVRRLDN